VSPKRDFDPTKPPPALAAWTELNDRQQGTLSAVYDLDQQVEAARRIDAARGTFDRRPAAEWRRIDFAHEPSDRRLFGMTSLQRKLEAKGWDNQGNGSTMAALAGRGLIVRGERPGMLGGIMHTVSLTRQGRAAARAGTSLMPGGKPKAALGHRAWEVLVMLWTLDRRGKILDWVHSTTIENVLIGKHIPPLAETVPGGYAITARGRDFYAEQYAAHCAAHPDVRAPHPDGADAEPWPARAEQLLTEHAQRYGALVAAWRSAYDMQQMADSEANTEPPEPVPGLPDAVAEQVAARHRLWQDTGKQRAALAAEHTTDVHQRAVHAARAYAVAMLAGFHAVVSGADPVAAMQGPDDTDDWDEPPLTLPAETGIHAIDDEIKRLHAKAVGRPVKRRGPAPTQKRRARRRSYWWEEKKPARPADPGVPLAELAKCLHGHMAGGELVRRVHPGRDRVVPRETNLSPDTAS
jgi:hypothetical protein